MYKVIGSDNREYGPASEEVLRRWIADGRANGGTQVKREGEEGWRSLSSLPEFAAALAAGIQPPISGAPATGGSTSGGGATQGAGAGGAAWSGATGADGGIGSGPLLTGSASAAAANALEAELLARAGSLDIGGCVQRSWEIFQKNAWLVVAAWAVSFFVSCGLWLIPYLGLPASMLLGAVLLAGLHVFFLRLLRGEPASIADVFTGFGPSIGPLILCGIVSFVLVCIGMIPCFIPAIYLFVAWHFAPILILDRRLEFWHAMELSRKVVTRHWWAVFGLAIVAFLLLFAGTLCCGIVVFITGPIATGAMVEAYRRLFETQGSGAVAVATPSSPAPTPTAPSSPIASTPIASTPAASTPGTDSGRSDSGRPDRLNENLGRAVRTIVLALGASAVAMLGACAGERSATRSGANPPTESRSGTSGSVESLSNAGRPDEARPEASWKGGREILSNDGAWRVVYKVDGGAIRRGEPFRVDAWVFDADAPEKPASGVSLAVDAAMPQHGHGMNRVPRIEDLGAGRFRIDGLLFHMPGKWELYFDVGRAGLVERAQTDVEVE